MGVCTGTTALFEKPVGKKTMIFPPLAIANFWGGSSPSQIFESVVDGGQWMSALEQLPFFFRKPIQTVFSICHCKLVCFFLGGGSPSQISESVVDGGHWVSALEQLPFFKPIYIKKEVFVFFHLPLQTVGWGWGGEQSQPNF